MGFLKGTPLVCALNEHCSHWARTYLKYCLCSTKDGVALSLGIVSVMSWGVAEVPQIIANYKAKSTEGLSLTFLMTWIVGDLFNLTGCLLEPATLPTQFYMALLYTVTTVLLAAQTIYYGHIYKRHKSPKLDQEETLIKKKLLYSINEKEPKTSDYRSSGSNPSEEGLHIPSSPIPVAGRAFQHNGSCGGDSYYMSARSLSRSPMPTAGRCLAHSRDSCRTPNLSHDQHSSREPLLGSLDPAESAPPLNTKNMLCVVSSSIFFLCTYGLHQSTNQTFKASSGGLVILVGRKLLQDSVAMASLGHGSISSGIGSFLGWAMAAIYMGGRLPQICLNMRRGHVEGLSPLMFIFALLGNATYVGSILVNSLDWSSMRPNLPWLVDAGGCVLLDACILAQFVYFRYAKPKDGERRDDH